MENKMKRFLSLLLAMVMVIGMLPTNVAFAAEDEDSLTDQELIDTDFTDAVGDEEGTGLSWDNETKTLTLSGAAVTATVVLPAGSTIVVAEGTENSVTAASGNAIQSEGALAITGTGKLNAVANSEAACAVVAPAVTITNTKIDLYGNYYAIQAKTTNGTADSVVTLNNVSGKIVGNICGGINAHSETANVTVKLIGCSALEIYNESNINSTSVNFNYVGVRAYTRGSGKNALVELNGCENVSVSNSTMAILAASNSSAANADVAEAKVLVKACRNVTLTGNTNCYSAVFVNNYGIENDDGSSLVIENSELKINAPRGSGLMTSTKSAPSEVDISGSTLTITAGASGIRTIASGADYADTDVSASNITFKGALAGNPVDESAGGVHEDTSYFDADSIIKVEKDPISVATVEALKAAIEAAESGDTIKLIADITLGENLTIGKNITLIGEHTITRADTYTGTLFTVNAGATLTLDGGLTVDGGNNWTYKETDGQKSFIYVAKNYVNPNGYGALAEFVTAEAGAPIATKDMIAVSGALVINDATLQNHWGNDSCNVIDLAQNGKLTMNEDAVITRNVCNGQGPAVYMNKDSKFTMNGGEICWNAGRHHGGGAVSVRGGYFTMNGGSINNNFSVDGMGVAVFVYDTRDHSLIAEPNFYMNGGEICSNVCLPGVSANRNGTAIYARNGIMEMNAGSICHNFGRNYAGVGVGAVALTVNGGSIVNNQNMLGNTDESMHDFVGEVTTKLYGGTYSQDVSLWCADGFKVEKNADGTYVVKEDPTYGKVAMIGETGYETLQAAINNATEGDIIKLIADITLSENLIIEKNITLVGEHTITRADDYTGTLFTVNTGATLTLDGGLTVDGNNNWSIDADNVVTPEAGKPVATGFMIDNGGTLNVFNATLQNQYSEGTGGSTEGAIIARTNSVTNLVGATIRHFYTQDAGSAVRMGHGTTTCNNATLNIGEGTNITGNIGNWNGALIIVYGSNTINMTGGSINNNIANQNGTLIMLYGVDSSMTMSGGVITENKGPVPAIYMHSSSSFEMTGGEISKNTGGEALFVRSNAGSASISGGKIVNNEADIWVSATKTDDVNISGGTFTQDVNLWCADGFKAEETADGTYVVREANYVAEVNGVKYESLADAVTAVPNNGTATIVILKDYTETKCRTTGDYAFPVWFGNGKNITLDFDGHTVTFDTSAYADHKIQSVFYVSSDNTNASLTLTGNGTVKYQGPVGNGTTNMPFMYMAWAQNCDIIVKNGTYIMGADSDTTYANMFYITLDGNIYIEDGTFIKDATGDETSFINVSDASDGVVTATGGTFYENILAETQEGELVIPDSYSLVDNGDGTWTVINEYIKMTAATLLYEDMIRIRYKFAVSEEDVVKSGLLIFASKEDAENLQNVLQDTVLVENANGSYYGYTAGIAAKNMGESQFAMGYAELSDGRTVYSIIKEYSPRIYAQNMVKKDTTKPETKVLCNALMNYGAAAQVYKGYKADELMNDGFSAIAYDASVLGADIFQVDITETNGFTTKSANLLFDGELTYRVKYAASEEITGNTLHAEYTVKGETKSVELKLINGAYYAYISGIAAKDMDEKIVVKPYYTDDSGNKVYGAELVYSGYEYVRRTVNNSKDANSVALAKAFAMYIDAADKAIAAK